MKIIYLTVILILSVDLYASELVLGGLRVDMTKEEMISKKGKPTKYTEQADFINEIYEYKDISIYFNGDSLIGIESNALGVCASDNICIGKSSLNDVRKVWGKEYKKEVLGENYLEFYVVEYPCWYRISESKLVASIEISCQP